MRAFTFVRRAMTILVRFRRQFGKKFDVFRIVILRTHIVIFQESARI